MRVTGQTTADVASGASERNSQMHRKGGSLLRPFARWLLIALLLVAPWLFASVEPWSWALLQCLTLAAVLAALGSGARDWNWRLYGPLLALAAYLAAQALNPSHTFDATLRSLAPRDHLAWLPSTADAATTWQTLLKLLTYTGLFWAARAAFTERNHAWTLVIALTISGFALTLVGLTQKLSGTTMILGLHKGGWFFFSTFINRNNYAAYINLLIPGILALIHHRRHLARVRNAKSDAGALLGFMVLLMALSIVMTGSRGGTAVCALTLLVWGGVEVARAIRSGGQTRNLFVVVSLASAALIGGLSYLGSDALQQRFALLKDVPAELAGSGGRGNTYAATWEMFEDHWVCGVGAGTFSMTYPYYSRERIDWFRRYAHNDWLQYFVELGVTGAAMLALAAAGLWRRRSRHRRDPVKIGGSIDWLAFALFVALTGVALHALVDFPLHIPAISTLAVVFLAIVTGDCLHRQHHESH